MPSTQFWESLLLQLSRSNRARPCEAVLLLEGGLGGDLAPAELLGTRVGDAPGAVLAAAFGPALEAGMGPAAEAAPAEVLAAAELGAVAAAWGLGADVSTFSGCLGVLAAACSKPYMWVLHFWNGSKMDCLVSS